MQSPAQLFPVLSFLGVIAQLGVALALIGLFVTLRRFVLRRAYFTEWVFAWAAFAMAIAVLVVRYFFVPGVRGTALEETEPVVRGLYFVYQISKILGVAYFVRGTLIYVGGDALRLDRTRNLWLGAVLFGAVSTAASARHGLNELVIWQSLVAVPALGYCASAFLWLPAPRRTKGSVATGACFALLACLWLCYSVGFGMAVRGIHGPTADAVTSLIRFNSYFDLTINLFLGYAMILVLMEDARREFHDAQAELAVTHDRLRRAALYDALTDSLNRRAYAEGVGLEMARATFGTAVLADLDNLKQVNDAYGHGAGDQLLRRCADAIRGTLRPYDRLYRWGGDEFLVIVPSAHASEVLTRLQGAIEGADPVEAGKDGRVARLAVSLGAADFTSSEELAYAIERADRAMYQEKARRKADLPVVPDARTPRSAAAVS